MDKTPTLQRLAGLARERWRVEQDYRELKGELGLDHFEGHNWPGWHHYGSLTCLAHRFLQSERAVRPAAGSTQKRRDEPPVRESLPQTRCRLHVALVRMCCARCPWCASEADTS